MSDRANEAMENRRDEKFDKHDGSRSTFALQNLHGYMNDPTNFQKKHEEEVKRLLQKVSEEFEQMAVKESTDLELEKRKIKDLEKRLKDSETDRDRYRNERNDYKNICKLYNKEHDKLSAEQEIQSKRETEELKNFHKQNEKEWEKKIKDSEESSNEIIQDLKQKIEQIQQDIKHRDIKIKSLEETFERNRFGFSDRSELKKKLDESEKQLNDTNDRLHRVSTKLSQTEKELEETKTRLSKAMGDKLTDNNPSIADLSDKNRPTKLAEKYAELYDNQWTDAYEEIERYFYSEEDVIQALLKILQNVAEFCKSEAKRQMEKLQSTLTFSEHQQTVKDVPGNITKQLKDLRKVMSTTSKQNLFQLYISGLRKTKDQSLKYALKIEPFVKESFEICWLMALQDPPVVLSPMARNGEMLNTDIYKPYTSSGSHIQFVVWPAMLLQEGGAVLAKGVAQGMNKKRHNPKLEWPDVESVSEVTMEDLDVGNRHSFNRGGFVSTRHQESYYSGQEYGKSYHKTERYSGTGVDQHHRSKSAEETKYPYKQAIVPSKTVGMTTHFFNPPPLKHEREPTKDDMKLFLYYIDRCDFTGAKNDLGNELYVKCWQKKRPLTPYL